LFVPAHVPRFIEKAPSAGADVICLDLEDAVPPDAKVEARQAAARAIEPLSSAAEVWVRVNSGDEMAADLDAVLRGGLSAVMLPKCQGAADIHSCADAIERIESERALASISVAIVPLLETARGVLHAEEICAASERVVAVAFGSEDFVADIGAIRSPEVLAHPRQHVVLAAATAGIPAIDTVDVKYHDEEYLEREMQAAKAMGFRGKLCIHPAQIAIANRIFAPSEHEIEGAREIVEAFEREGLTRGRAAISIRGKMVDTPHYQRARRLLESASKDRTAQ
jgi:citrate lyase subunit beta/citryl-CoA lyase